MVAAAQMDVGPSVPLVSRVSRSCADDLHGGRDRQNIAVVSLLLRHFVHPDEAAGMSSPFSMQCRAWVISQGKYWKCADFKG